MNLRYWDFAHAFEITLGRNMVPSNFKLCARSTPKLEGWAWVRFWVWLSWVQDQIGHLRRKLCEAFALNKDRNMRFKTSY